MGGTAETVPIGHLVLILSSLVWSSMAMFQCYERKRCRAMVGYRPRVPMTLGAIQRRFNVTNILAANGFPEWTSPENFTVDGNRVIKIPLECNCTGSDRSVGEAVNPPVYEVPPGFNITYITTTLFSGLVSSDDIMYGNNIANINVLMVGQQLLVPLPCSCGKVNGMEVVHFGLTLEYGLTVEQIAREYRVQEQTIWNLNPADNRDLLLGKALDIPLPVCSSMVRNDSLDYPLLVPNGSYVYTANGCVRCNCDAAKNWTLSCEASKLKPTNWSACPSMQCDNSSNMYIGNTTYSSSHQNLTICAYAGYGSQTIFTTLATMSIPPSFVHDHDTKNRWWIWFIIGVGAVLAIIVILYFGRALWRKHKAKVHSKQMQKKLLHEIGGNAMLSMAYGKTRTSKNKGKTGNEVEIFTFESIVAATNNFSAANKLGEGGFGPVYKGTLSDQQEVAIKRLSKSSGQGLIEFMNEAKLMAKLQHTNLVKLLGFCIQRDERILVYEYMSNKSLDFYLFGSTRKNLLDWEKRLNIIGGIAQGLLYLHKYSRLKVVHRDLKASNILLDDELNPKISDFGMARIFGLRVSEENTNRVVGTYGYMAPEYAINGIVSIKIDVFSFGVLLLEILSGKKNNSHHHLDRPLNLIGYAWQLWNEGRALELIAPTLSGLKSNKEVLRCIHIGLLCVQDQATDRPTMIDIVSFLSNDTIQLPQPKQPAFFINVVVEESELPYCKQEHHSLNDVTISRAHGR
ncbi:hypothetical protein RJT34_28178 [Clitoria ternatea]|uniref:non-specific serine/threonine protein kinase n=1 Tax=Clitoria ternatea TaxID=43366 RepID=A0AAN9FHB7_CLITE